MHLLALDTAAIDTSYACLRELVMDARLLPNSYHLEMDIAERLGHEPEVVHHAIVRLQDDNLVRLEPRGGFWVTPLSIPAIRATYEQLSMIEGRAVAVAATNGPRPIAISALYDAVSTMEDALYRGDNNRWAYAVHHFHRSLVQSSADQPLIAAALQLSEPVHRARMVTLALGPPPVESAQNHVELICAIRRGAAREARMIHTAHWQTTAAATLRLIADNALDQISI